ncbi:MAG: class I SAM-dependent methyltransferase [Nitrospirae bacterium]|nr:class I SAM-dependent methyltransferase [Nitrospirota bacterium]
MAYIDFISRIHRSTKRDYVQRVVEHDKAECAEVAIKFGREYWDGDRRFGYGGYKYDGRWRAVAEAMASHYALKPGSTILDVGCGRGFLLYDLSQVVPGSRVAGIDISLYGIETAKPELRGRLAEATAARLPFKDRSFDFVVTVNALHNLHNYDLWRALGEIERVGRGAKHIIIEAYRSEREKVNLMYWQLTCRAMLTPREWEWLFEKTGYTGDYSYITFE